MIDTLMHAAVEVAMDSDRTVNLTRPSRSHSVVREAATVPAKWRAFAECVLRRESGGVLDNWQSREDARSGASSASGRWQMLDASGWRDGGAWLVFKRLRSVGLSRDEAHRVRRYLAATPIYRWDGAFQDMAFIQSVREGGWQNWRNGDRCDGLVPR